MRDILRNLQAVIVYEIYMREHTYVYGTAI